MNKNNKNNTPILRSESEIGFLTNPSIGFMTNPSINPTFPEDTPVILDADYTESDPICCCSIYFTKNAVGSVSECGLSKYDSNPETNRDGKFVDGEEWCYLQLVTPIADFDNSEGWVKAKDLRDVRTLSGDELASKGYNRIF